MSTHTIDPSMLQFIGIAQIIDLVKTWRRTVLSVHNPHSYAEVQIMIGGEDGVPAGYAAALHMEKMESEIPDKFRDGKHHFWFPGTKVRTPFATLVPHMYQPAGKPDSPFWLGWSPPFTNEGQNHIEIRMLAVD